MKNSMRFIFAILSILLVLSIGFLAFKKNKSLDTPIDNQQDTAREEIATDSNTATETPTQEQAEMQAQEPAKKEYSPNLYVLGKNEHGQLGESDVKEFTDVLTPVAIGKTFVKIAAGRSHGVGITSEGDVYTWGRNNLGQLGYKTDDIQYNPVPHLVMSGAKDVVVGQDHTLVLKKDGTVWGFGSNYTAAIGDGTNTDRTTPVKVSGISNISNVFTGYKFSMAIDSSGKVYAWGATCAPSGVRVAADLAARINTLDGGYYDPVPEINPNGYDHNQDCINEEVIGIHSKSPIEMPTLSGVTKDIAIGYGHAIILENDGSVWSFGCNLYGQMGNRNYNNKIENAKPQKILDIDKVVKISAGFRQSFAITENGDVYMWGLNSKVENGYKLLNSSSPVKVDGINGKDIKEIVGGYDIAFALMNYGDIYTWGANTNHVVKGQKDQMLAPVKMLISKKITSVAAGIDTILFLIK